MQYDDWKAPKSDFAQLTWPTVDQIIADARSTHEKFSSEHETLVQNQPLADLREQIRLRHFGSNQSRTVFATGHQIELYHPGVWVKNVLIDQLARTADGTALHIAVDTDAPKHLDLRWPGGGIATSDDPAISDADWSGAVRAPTPAHVNAVNNAVSQATEAWSFAPQIKPLMEALAKAAVSTLSSLPSLPSLPSGSLGGSAGTGSSLVDAIVSASAVLDKSLGLNVRTILLSDLLQDDAYLLYLHHIAAHADHFASSYNAALADYRVDNHIKSAMRPMPDLVANDVEVELPFWLDDLRTGSRSRAKVTETGRGFSLLSPAGNAQQAGLRSTGNASHDQPTFEFIPPRPAAEAVDTLRTFLGENQLRLSPRALTLTAFLRLFVVDQFVHGIGGGRYDQVTDRLLQRFWKVEPPPFCVTTATLFFPGAGERQEVCTPCMLSDGHRIKHGLLPNKQQLVKQIADAPRHSPKRRTLYVQLHAKLAEAEATTGLRRQWREKLRATVAAQEQQAKLFDRELYYGLQSRERLIKLINIYRGKES